MLMSTSQFYVKLSLNSVKSWFSGTEEIIGVIHCVSDTVLNEIHVKINCTEFSCAKS